MKKLMSVLVAVVFMAGMVVAQNNTATTTVEGDGNESSQEQYGGNNYSEYGVTGDGNEFTGYQDNTMKESNIGNDMKIDQLNWYQAENMGNVITATQLGDENDIDALLKGDDNVVNFHQEGRENIIRGKGIGITTAGSEVYNGSFTDDPFKLNSDYSTVNIEQLGQYNIVEGDIQGNWQDVDIYQESGDEIDDNYSSVLIRAAWGSTPQYVDVDQIGQNSSWVEIHGDGNDVTHYQYGTDNEPNPYIGNNTAETYIEGDGNISDIEQEGNNSGITELQLMSGHTIPDPKGAEHHIYGDDNTAETEQDGNDNLARIEQRGDDNTAKQVQDAWTYGGYEEIPNNEADYNQSYIYQEGTLNEAETYQSGDYNVVNVNQYGSENTAVVDQGLWDQRYTPGVHGSNNISTVDQWGFGNTATVKINGSGNNTSIHQEE